MNITIARRNLALLILAIVAGTALLTTTAAYFGFKAAALNTTTVAAQAAPTTSVVAPAVDNGVAAELKPGTGDKSYVEDDEFRCKAGFVPIQVPTGETKQISGAKYTVKETRTSYGDQETVQVTIKLPTNVSAQTMIVNTAAHIKAPTVYPQHMLQIALAAGGSGSYTLKTDAYADNYLDGGITDIMICTKPSK